MLEWYFQEILKVTIFSGLQDFYKAFDEYDKMTVFKIEGGYIVMNVKVTLNI